MIETRFYTDADYEAVKRNLEEGNLFDPTIDTRETLWAKLVDNPQSILVASVNGNVVGSVYILQDRRSSFIFRLAVQTDYRKQGVGRRLVEEAESILRRKGIRDVALWVREDHQELQEYYKRLGYTPTAVSHRCMHKEI